MRAGHILDGYRWKVILPLAALGSALAIGLIPSLWTAIALDLGLTVVGVIAILRRARREGGLALREADSSAYAPFGLPRTWLQAASSSEPFLRWRTSSSEIPRPKPPACA
jgi:hypothetical protein